MSEISTKLKLEDQIWQWDSRPVIRMIMTLIKCKCSYKWFCKSELSKACQSNCLVRLWTGQDSRNRYVDNKKAKVTWLVKNITNKRSERSKKPSWRGVFVQWSESSRAQLMLYTDHIHTTQTTQSPQSSAMTIQWHMNTWQFTWATNLPLPRIY